jgi:hypothetical protein
VLLFLNECPVELRKPLDEQPPPDKIGESLLDFSPEFADGSVSKSMPPIQNAKGLQGNWFCAQMQDALIPGFKRYPSWLKRPNPLHRELGLDISVPE